MNATICRGRGPWHKVKESKIRRETGQSREVGGSTMEENVLRFENEKREEKKVNE